MIPLLDEDPYRAAGSLLIEHLQPVGRLAAATLYDAAKEILDSVVVLKTEVTLLKQPWQGPSNSWIKNWEEGLQILAKEVLVHPGFQVDGALRPWILVSDENWNWLWRFLTRCHFELSGWGQRSQALNTLIRDFAHYQISPLFMGRVGKSTPFPTHQLPVEFQTYDPLKAHRLYYWKKNRERGQYVSARKPFWWTSFEAALASSSSSA